MFATALTLSALAFIPVEWGGGNGILHALNASGLDRFSNAVASLNGTSGQYILTELSQGNKTVFGPTDQALSGVDAAIIHNETLLADLVSYHIVPGNFVNQTQTYPNVTIGRTLLNASNLVMLEGNQSQVLVWSKSDNGSLFVTNQGSNITVVNTTSYDNTTILAINSVLTPPPNISAILADASYNLTAIPALLKSASVVNGTSLLNSLTSARGITVFAPNNAAVQAAESSLSGLAKNATALLNLFSNHIINGTSVYSTEISNRTTLTSAGGQQCAFVVNSTGYFVSVGGSNQVEIVEKNVLASNGVIHIVNGVMVDTNSNPAAASSAYASATFAAAHTTQTGLVTATATSAVASTSSGASTSTPTSTSIAASATSTSTATFASTATSTSTSTGVSATSQARAAKSKISSWKLGVLTGMVVGLGQFV